MIKPQQYQYWKMMTITPFIFVNNFFILYSNFYHFLFACVDCAYDRLDYFDGDVFINNCFIYVCYTLDSLILNLFVLATVEESSLNSSSYLYYCSLSKFSPNYHCMIVNHRYYDYFYRYHLHNILCVEAIYKFCVDFNFLDTLKNPLGIFLR